MAAISQYHARETMDHIFGKTSYAMPANLWVGLSSTAPAADGTGVTEPAVGAYARVSTAPADWNAATTATPSLIDNANIIQFPTPTVDWGADLTHFVIYDAASAGNLLWFGSLTEAKTIQVGDDVQFNAGDLNLTLG